MKVGKKNHYWFFCFCFSYLWHSCLVKTAPQVISTFFVLYFDFRQFSAAAADEKAQCVFREREAGDAVLILVQSRKKVRKEKRKNDVPNVL